MVLQDRATAIIIDVGVGEEVEKGTIIEVRLI